MSHDASRPDARRQSDDQAKPVLLITGASRGIGAATARQAAELGYDIAINYKTDKASAEAVASACAGAGARVAVVQGDVADERAVAAMFAAVEAELGPVSHLVNNAGILHQQTGGSDVVGPPGGSLAVNVIGSFSCA
ncbi:MAG: SDR family NAD(P)-dependent oxidoreductase [Acidimicrobiales bacterium]